jgi:hypothetical protein
MENLTHWKKTVDKDWIGTYILPEDGKAITVTLIGVEYKEVKVRGVENWYLIANFAKNKWFDKPMLLSANVNKQRLEKLIGTPYIERWENLNMKVTLQQEMDKAIGGGRDWALRIGEKAPKKEKLTGQRLEDAKQAIIDGKITIEKVLEDFDVTKEQLI